MRWRRSHPRLILTPRRIEALKSSLPAARAGLWKPALESANQFRDSAPPAMRRADNTFRYIGDTLPALGLACWMTGDRAYAESAGRWLRALLAVKEWSGSANLGRSSLRLGSALLYDWLHGSLDEATLTAAGSAWRPRAKSCCGTITITGGC